MNERELAQYTASRRRTTDQMMSESGQPREWVVGKGLSPSCAALFRRIVAAGSAGVDPADPTVDQGWLPNLEADELVVCDQDGRYRATGFAAQVLPHVE